MTSWNVPNQVYDKRGSNLRKGTEVFDLIQSIQVRIVISLGVRINCLLPGIET
jgi:hypothetical protein